MPEIRTLAGRWQHHIAAIEARAPDVSTLEKYRAMLNWYAGFNAAVEMLMQITALPEAQAMAGLSGLQREMQLFTRLIAATQEHVQAGGAH